MYLERASYETLEENTRVEVFVVRDGNYSTVTDVLFTTVDSTALGIIILRLGGSKVGRPKRMGGIMYPTTQEDCVYSRNCINIPRTLLTSG